jgi:hypothetical protein
MPRKKSAIDVGQFRVDSVIVNRKTGGVEVSLTPSELYEPMLDMKHSVPFQQKLTVVLRKEVAHRFKEDEVYRLLFEQAAGPKLEEKA